MHLIPASWSHLHILVSVFPSVGLIFVLGFYVASLLTNNELMKRACLTAFGILALLAIPVYFSGDGSVTALSHDPKISADRMDNHTGWAYAALTLLVFTGIAAWYELWRFRRVGRLSENALHLVLGLSILTLAFMVVVGELGWEISHHELQMALRASPGVSASDIPEGVGTPQSWSHVHMIINHFPTVGFVIALAFYIGGLVMDNNVMKRSSLVAFVICAILGAPTYVTGAAAMWALTDPPIPGITKAAIDAHRD